MTRFRQHLPRWCSHLCFLALLLAGLAKAADLSEFAQALSTWALLPQWSIPFLTVGVPTVEILTAGLWFLNTRRPAALWVAAFTLIAFTAAYLLHLWLAEPPNCGCTGKLKLFENQTNDVRWNLGRNFLMLFLLLPSLLQTSTRIKSISTPTVQRHAEARSERGFTLVESLIVAMIVAVLVALSLPSLIRVREAARGTASLATMRSHANIFSMYAADYRDYFPFITDPAATFSVLRCGDTAVSAAYFDATVLWNLALCQQYYDGAVASPVFAPPRLKPEVFSYYWYSSTFLSSPEFWDPSTRTGPSQWRATTLAEVLFPSKKGLLLNGASLPGVFVAADPRTPAQVAFVDSSAALVPKNSLTPGYAAGEGAWPGCRVNYPIPVMHTPQGVRGRDIP